MFPRPCFGSCFLRSMTCYYDHVKLVSRIGVVTVAVLLGLGVIGIGLLLMVPADSRPQGVAYALSRLRGDPEFEYRTTFDAGGNAPFRSYEYKSSDGPPKHGFD